MAAHPHEPVAFVDLVDFVGHDGHDEALLVVAAHHLLPQLLHPLLGPLERVLRRIAATIRPRDQTKRELSCPRKGSGWWRGDERTGSVAS